MKNTLYIDATNGCECSLLSSVNDGTNRFFLEIHSDLSKNPQLEISENAITITEEAFSYEVSSDLFTGEGTLSFRIVDDNNAGEYFQIFKATSLNGNVSLKQLSNFVYRLSASVQNTTGVPIATSTSLGVIKIGSTLNITSDGTLNTNQGGLMTPISNLELEELLGGAQAIIETVPIISDEYINETCQ